MEHVVVATPFSFVSFSDEFSSSPYPLFRLTPIKMGSRERSIDRRVVPSTCVWIHCLRAHIIRQNDRRQNPRQLSISYNRDAIEVKTVITRYPL